ncbi:MAG: glycoside hydrolase family 32 protein [Chitinophagaceae bacterium]
MPYRLLNLLLVIILAINAPAQTGQFRPQLHFSPTEHWMNDPNGMYYNNGVYHLFFQYYPGGTKWGPMHWGHATSKNLLNWKEEPIALYPDSLGYIFSGSAVVDKNNTSGFGKNGKTPIVAIFTHHDPVGEKEKRKDYQVQSLAYSLDDGMTWTKYAGNPVLKNPGIVDFRDPKVNWNKKISKWVMTLATKDRISFYSSPNLKDWTKLSEFGETLGAHGGVWECPDLFPLTHKGKEYWVLLVSINPGGPNGGSATQYFIGDFDGKNFIPADTTTRFMDYGTDNYAGVTINNTGDRVILIGWMSNWLYAESVPTVKWRSAMTLPRELGLKEVNGKPWLVSVPAKEVARLDKNDQPRGEEKALTKKNEALKWTMDKGDSGKPGWTLSEGDSLMRLHFDLPVNDFNVTLSNTKSKTVVGFDKESNRFYIDRTEGGIDNFYPGFAKRHWAPRISTNDRISVNLIVDVMSVEFFADGGLTVMTDIFFPVPAYTLATLSSAGLQQIQNLGTYRLIPTAAK